MSFLKQFLSTEEHTEVAEVPEVVEAPVVEPIPEGAVVIEIPKAVPVTEDEVIEAEIVLEEIEDEYREVQAAEVDAEVLLDEIEEERASMEAFLQVLEHGLERKEFSPQFAATVHVALERYGRLLGEEGEQLPSLEHYGHDTLEAFYVVSQESIRGFIQRIDRLLPNLLNRVHNTLYDLTAKAIYKSLSNTITKTADRAIGLVSNVSESRTVNLKGKERVLNQGGVLPKNILEAVRKDQASRISFADRVVKPYLAMSGEIFKVIGRAKLEGGEKVTSQILEDILKLKVPYNAVSDDYSSGRAFIDTTAIYMEDVAVPTSGKLSAKLKQFRSGTIRYAAAAKPSEKLGEFQVSPKDVVELAKLAKVYVALHKKAAAEFQKTYDFQQVKNLWRQFRRANLTDAPLASWEDDKALDYAVDAGIRHSHRAAFLAGQHVEFLLYTGRAVAKLAHYLAKELTK